MTGLLDRYGVVDLPALQAKIVAALTQRSESLAGRAVDIGGEALDLIVGFCIAMYLMFFLLRDGAGVARDVRAAIPLAPGPKERLLERFTTVIRAPSRATSWSPRRRARSAASPSGPSACTRRCSGAW
jgi:predicted PurR-regulated permease PerM